jgi:dihydrofolate synthase/folylpolyglutamate synthase
MNNQKFYQATLDYLYSFVDYSLTKSFGQTPIDFSLDRLLELMDLLGYPYRNYPIIHIAGTKGKGSVTALCAAALRQAGYEVGMYTSPHLQDYCERIQVNGQPISHDNLVSLIDDLKPVIAKVPKLTTFEITTALGFVYFERQNVDVAAIEVGLGGRLDATNVVTPVVSVITSISYDHMVLLGNTLAEIAGEKAGIIKPGIPVVVAPQELEARLSIEAKAKQKGAPLVQVGEDILFSLVSHSMGGQTFLTWGKSEQPLLDRYMKDGGQGQWEPTRLTIPLLGYHQVENAATAYAALQVFRENALDVSDADINKGFQKTKWPGRFEVIGHQPIIVLDSAHNRDSALKLRLALDDYFPGKRVVMIFGISEDKDLRGMFTELLPRVDQVVAMKSFHPRALEPEKIVEMAHQFGRPAHLADDIRQALEEATQIAKDEAIILITGSIFVVSEAREILQKQSNPAID